MVSWLQSNASPRFAADFFRCDSRLRNTLAESGRLGTFLAPTDGVSTQVDNQSA